MLAPSISEARGTALREYLHRLAAALQLSRWSILLGADYPTKPGAWLSTEATPGRMEAVIRIGEGFWELGTEDTRSACVHELAHLFTIRMFHMVREDLVEHFSDSAYSVFMSSFKRELEYATDALAAVLEKNLALPPVWPE